MQHQLLTSLPQVEYDVNVCLVLYAGNKIISSQSKIKKPRRLGPFDLYNQEVAQFV